MQIMQTSPAAALTMVGARAAPTESPPKGGFQVERQAGPPGNAPPTQPEAERKPQGTEPNARPEKPDPLEEQEAKRPPRRATESLLEKAVPLGVPMVPAPVTTPPEAADGPLPTDSVPIPPTDRGVQPAVAPGGSVGADKTTSDGVPLAGAQADLVQTSNSERVEPTPSEVKEGRADVAPPSGSDLGRNEVDRLGIVEVKVDRGDPKIDPPPTKADGSIESEPAHPAADLVSSRSEKAPQRPTEPDGPREPAGNPQADLVAGGKAGKGSPGGDASHSGDSSGWRPQDGAPHDTVDLPAPKAELDSPKEGAVAHAVARAGDAAPVARAGSDPSTAPVDRASIVRQVADRLELLTAARPREGVTIRLNPVELGSITLTVRQRGGEVETQVLASHDAVRAALEQSRPQLQHALEVRGLSLGSLEVGSQASQLGRDTQHAPDGTFPQRAFQTQEALGGPIALRDWRDTARSDTGVDLWI